MKARLGWIPALIVVASTATGTYFAYKQTQVIAASASIKIGTLGVLSWTESPPVAHCEQEEKANLLACYSSYIRGAMSPIAVPIESEVAVWRRLNNQFNVFDSRRGRLPFPILYSIDFGQESLVLTLETRAQSEKEAVSLLRTILDKLMEEHRDRVQDHRVFLKKLANSIQNRGVLGDNLGEAGDASPGEKLAIFTALSIAVERTQPTVYVAGPRLLPRAHNAALTRLVSALVIGVILAGVFSVFRSSLRD